MSRFKKKILSLILVCILCLTSLTGCTSLSSLFDRQSSSSDTKVITDCIGREVEIPKNPKRLAALYPYCGDLVAMFGHGNDLVAIVNGLKREVIMSYKVDNLDDLIVPFSGGAINIEELISAKPDLVFVRNSTATTESEVEKLDKAKIPYVTVDYTTTEEQIKSIKVMGDALGEEEKAQEYIKFYEDTINLVKDRVKDIKEEDKVRVYHSVNEAVRTDSAGSIGDEVMKIAGLINVATDANLEQSGEKSYTTLEEIYKWNPDSIVATENYVKEYILTDEKWKGLDCVQNKKIYTLPVGISRWGHPSSMENHMAALFLAKLYYPEKFEDIDLNEYTRDFYQKFF
ncbi:MAG: ABC transporter substrate-binding protein, partial [Intestinibacter sp.]